jgi:hypothetical protein
MAILFDEMTTVLYQITTMMLIFVLCLLQHFGHQFKNKSDQWCNSQHVPVKWDIVVLTRVYL